MGQNPYSHLRFSVNEDALKDPEATTKIVWLFEMQAYGVELDPKDSEQHCGVAQCNGRTTRFRCIRLCITRQ
jgi:imidazole glycerol phosphate synthase subunit HisF